MANIALKHNNERGKDGEGNRFPDPEYKGWQWGSRGEIMSSEKDREKEREKQTNEHAQMARTSADLKRIWKMSRKNHIKAMLYATQSQSVVQHIGIHHFVSEKPFFFQYFSWNKRNQAPSFDFQKHFYCLNMPLEFN